MITKLAFRFLSLSVKRPCRRVTTSVLPRFIQTSSLLLKIDEPIEPSVPDSMVNDKLKNDKIEEHFDIDQQNFDIDEKLLPTADTAEYKDITFDEQVATYLSPDADDVDDFEHGDDDIREEILGVALDLVPQYGWSTKSIEKAVEQLKLSPSSADMFKRGGLDLVLFFIEEANNSLIEYLAKETKETKINTEEARAAFIEKAMKIRLQMIIPVIDTWPEALTLMASPMAAREVFENGANLMDEIWYHAGDLDTDFSWYTKRAALAAISASTELFMLNDKSADYKDTWDFLHRRLNDARALDNVKDSLGSATGDTIALLNAGITTAQNILGMGSKKR